MNRKSIRLIERAKTAASAASGKKLAAIAIFCAMTVVGCLQVNERIKLKWNGSGTAEIKMTVPDKLAMQRFGPKINRQGMIPLTEEEFMRQMPNRRNLDVKKLEMKDSGEVNIIDAVIDFKNIADLSQGNFQFEVEGDGASRRLWFRIKKRNSMMSSPNKSPAQQEAFRIGAEQKLAGMGFEFVFDLPGKPRDIIGGKAEGKTVTFSIPLSEYLLNNEEIIYSVRYKKGIWRRVKEFFLGPQAG